MRTIRRQVPTEGVAVKEGCGKLFHAWKRIRLCPAWSMN